MIYLYAAAVPCGKSNSTEKSEYANSHENVLKSRACWLYPNVSPLILLNRHLENMTLNTGWLSTERHVTGSINLRASLLVFKLYIL